MKKAIFCLFMLVSQVLIAQKEDYVWVIGHDYNFDDSMYGRIVIDFKTAPLELNYYIGNVNLNMFVSNASISDTTGKLLFYSNGCDIANENGNIMLNGENINPGEYHTSLCDDIGRGYFAGYPSMVILPKPDTDSLYYLFHMSTKYVSAPIEDAYVDRLLYSIIKIKNNKKIVLSKNIPILIDSLATGEMNAVKHANGKDWWIILPRRNSNQFYVFLFTKDGIVDTLTQTLGAMPPADKEGYGQTTFSPDGTRMIRYFPYTPIMNFSFDRSTGHFTSYNTFSVNYGSDFAAQGGCAISPNSRYLYIAALLQVYQFDLWASDISSSQVKVAVWDGFLDPVAISFLTCQLGPDCKIYILGGGDTRYYHIIHNPDEPGLACNFEQRGLVLPTPSGASIPYFPNYRLGPIDNPGVPCTATVSVSATPSAPPQIRAYPNPASEQVTIEWGSFISGSKRLTLCNTIGQPVKDLWLSAGSASYVLSLEHLPAGVYFWVMQSEAGLPVGSGKIVKQ